MNKSTTTTLTLSEQEVGALKKDLYELFNHPDFDIEQSCMPALYELWKNIL